MRDLFEYWLLPGLAMLLPWRLCFRLYRRIAGSEWLLERETAAAFRAASGRGFVSGDPREWRRRFRLVLLCDRADLFLVLTRSDRWLDRHVRRAGDPWPAARPCLFVTCHYGAGFWVLRELLRLGVRVAFLSIRFDRSAFPGAPLQWHYARLRLWAIGRVGGAPPIMTGGARTEVLRALGQGTSVCGLVDMPAAGDRGFEAAFLGTRVRFATGLIECAIEAGVPVAAFAAEIDPDSGTRHVRVDVAPSSHDATDVLGPILARLDEAIRRDSSGWHFWAHFPLGDARRDEPAPPADAAR